MYRGPDRRQGVPESRRCVGGLPLALVVAVVVVCVLIPWLARDLDDVHRSLTTDALRALAPALLFGAAMVWLARWRLTAEASVASTVVALALVACLVFPLDLAAGLLFDDARWQQNDPAGWTVVTPMVFVVLWRGLREARVDSRSRPMLLVLVMGGAVAVAFVGAVVAHQVGGLTFDPPVGRVQVAELGAAALWGVLAAHHAWDGLRRGRATRLWTAVALALIGLACAYRALAITRDGGWYLAAAVVVTAAAALALWSATEDLAEVYAHQGDRYASMSSAAATAEQVLTHEHERQEEMVHDARSAIASVRAVSYHLGRWSEGLAPDLRADLARALTDELGRLESLIERPAAPTETFELAACLDPLLTVHQQSGARVRAAIEPAWVCGSRVDLTTAVENLLGNARRHAPGSAVDVWSETVGEDVHLLVGDRGPGVPLRERERVFERGVRGAASAGVEGSGLGLHISRSLVVAHGGDLRLVAREGGGALFDLVLPAARPVAALSLPGSPAGRGEPLAVPPARGGR